jgi:hemerythrin
MLVWYFSGKRAMSSQNETPPWRLEWTDELSVDIPEIDAEHQHFIQLVNEFNEAIVSRMDMTEVIKRTRAILEDAEKHFYHEEALFKKWNYPAAKEHEDNHAQIIIALHDIMKQLERGGTEYSWIQAGLSVKNSLVHHLLTEDLKYRDFVRMNA